MVCHMGLSEGDLRVIVEMSNDAILVFSEEGKVEYANRTAFEFFGRKGLLGSSVFELLGDGVREAFSALRGKGDKVCQELCLEGIGKVAYACFFLMDDGKPRRFCAYLTDVTSRREFEERLRASERRYRELFEKVQEGVFISTVEGRFLDCNQAFLEMLGYETKEELLEIFIPTDLYVNPEDRKFLQRQIQQEGYIKDWEVEFKRKDGSRITVLHTAHAVRDESGRIVGYEGMSVDITQRKRLEEELKASNEFLKGIIESSPYGIIATDMKGNILIFNRAAEELLGYRAEEVIGKMHISELYPPGMAKEVMKKLRSEDYGGKGRFSGELKVLNRYGEEIPIHLSAALVYRDGKEVASLGIFTDLRPRLEMEKRLQETQLQLLQSEKLRSLGEMAAGVAHEINNPLGGILLYASLLLEELSPEDQKRKDVERIVSEATRCKEIVKSLLEFARQSSPDKELVNVNSAINEGLLFLENQATFHNIRIVKELDPGLPPVYGNVGQLKQVFMNIMLNAVDAMHGEGTLTIRTSLSQDAREVIISFTDTGVGIPKEILPRIFDPFFTTKEVGKGTGLGLSVSYGIVKEHGGRIEVESEVGKGSTFRVILPAAEGY
ncbi:MAG: PAS domain-containing sensor histidine kinase [Deltaproteobacteria bacterium]|nr:MAG: PAS domain-containing sensor histidine kinase [Deltaproteobacteria bacterium]